MEQIKTSVRKWGDSVAIIIPKRLAEKERIRPEDRVVVSINKEMDLSDLFGKLKIKKSAQELKDESRESWE